MPKYALFFNYTAVRPATAATIRSRFLRRRHAGWRGRSLSRLTCSDLVPASFPVHALNEERTATVIDRIRLLVFYDHRADGIELDSGSTYRVKR
jgi:hypothetical protein